MIALEEALRSAESALEATEIILDSVVPGCSKEPGAHQKPSNVQLDATTLPVQPAADENNIQQQATEPTGNADKTTEIVKDNARGRGGSRRGAKMRGGSKKEKPS
ncbi:unnamed protein product [Allacma fusca]|uniref:Uncharacterized protein n=1 Tax=Allacma fusca TaxID=39272 RepID=A0A8J2KND7_9HEXA|nr:unnamed protein product [Allacma fusca]